VAYPLVAAGRTPLPPGTAVEHFARPRIDFHSRFFFGSISIARLSSKMHFWARSGREAMCGHRPYPPFPRESFYSIQGFQHGRKPFNLAIILQHSRFPTWKQAQSLTWLSFYSTQGFQHRRKPTNLAIILQHSKFST